MPPLNQHRCPRDEPPGGTAQIGTNPNNGNAIVLGAQGVASVLAVQSAMMTLSAAMRHGHEKDFLEKVALSVFGKLSTDPHALCPLFTVVSFCLLMLRQAATIGFDDEGHILIAMEEDESIAGHQCIFDYDQGEQDDGPNETNLDGTGGSPDIGGGNGQT